MRHDIKMERFLNHPPEKVWKALTESRALASWYMQNDFQPVVGHRFTFKTDPGPGFDGVLFGEVMEVDPPHKLVYSFRGGFMKRETIVTWKLAPKDGGTLLRLEHIGFTGFPDVLAGLIIRYGWGKFLKQLPDALENL